MTALFPLFDPPRNPDDAGAPGGSDGVLSVSELNALVRATLEAGFGDITVRGEVSNVARPRSGHVYFVLKDASAQLKAVLWKRDAQRLVFDLDDGLAVRLRGTLSVYEPRGDYQMLVREIEPEGVGALDLAFRQVVARLEAEGLFALERKRPLPKYPRRIALIASPTGAAVRDVIRVAATRWPLAELVVVPSRVQGDGASAELVAALGLANGLPDVDFVILARGGGSLEDLWAFNEEILARAIFQSRVPVVSAVGHEVDRTVADLVADHRAPTPSAAAAQCLPDIAEVRRRLDALAERLSSVVQATTRQARQRLDGLAQRARYALHRRLDADRQRLDTLTQRATHALRLDLDRRRAVLSALAAKLDALGPLAVLSRGYSLTQRLDDGRIVRSAADVRPGERVRIRLAQGTLVARVEEG
jgi:exodeoxyribonuclease VII large subunit